MKRSEIEIMAPIGSYESLWAAVKGGADSVYFGVEGLNMRARSSVNFTLDDLAEIVRIAKDNGLKSYLTVNTVLYDDDIETMRNVLDRAKTEGVTAIIAADQAAILYARSIEVEVHISTQVNVSNSEALRFYSQWADVVVLARELSLPQIKKISQTIERENICGPNSQPVQIEMFAHGALCMAISGKCYLSLHETGCSANRGACRQICRRSYELRDRDTGEEIVMENRYLLSPKDLCTIGFLDKFLDAGVRVLKIEGRARGGEYVKRVVECYNEAIESIVDGSYSPEKIENWEQRLATVFNRGHWGGYYQGATTVELSKNYGSSATKKKVYVGKVTNFFKNLSVAEILVEASPLTQGDEVIILGETTGVVELTVNEIHFEQETVDAVTQGGKCSIVTPELVRRGDKLYKMVDSKSAE